MNLFAFILTMRNPLLLVGDDHIRKGHPFDSAPAHAVRKMNPTVPLSSKQLNENRRTLLKEIDNAKFS